MEWLGIFLPSVFERFGKRSRDKADVRRFLVHVEEEVRAAAKKLDPEARRSVELVVSANSKFRND